MLLEGLLLGGVASLGPVCAPELEQAAGLPLLLGLGRDALTIALLPVDVTEAGEQGVEVLGEVWVNGQALVVETGRDLLDINAALE